jgi:two-component system chemotaxis response regulator CheB
MYANVHKTPARAGFDRESAMIRQFKPAFDVVAIAGSAGGVDAIGTLLSALPVDFPAAILVVQHLPPSARYKSVLDRVLGRRTSLRVKWAEQGDRLQPQTALLAPQDKHISITDLGTLQFSFGPKVNSAKPAADPLFVSVADHYGERAIAVVMTGCLCDGAEGARAIAQHGGRVLVQDRITSPYFDMPEAVMQAGGADFVLSPHLLASALITLVMAPGAATWFRVGSARRIRLSRHGARINSAPALSSALIGAGPLKAI